MHQYFFVLGKNPTLSLAEIYSCLNKLKIIFQYCDFSRDVLLVTADVSIEKYDVIRILGGTVKFGKILDRVGLNEEESRFEEVFLPRNLKEKYFSNTEKKLHFGLSIYNCGGEKLLDKLTGRIKKLSLTIKRNLQEQGIKAGFLMIKGDKLSSVSVAKNNLLGSKGAEIVLVLTAESIYIGKTLSVQEFADFSFRDFGRPERDKRAGIIPPKLARMMINFSQTDKDKVILDPFCGSGTVIQEAVMLGYMNSIGSDVSERAVSSAKKNIDWLFSNFRQLNKSSYNIKWWVSDVRVLNTKLEKSSVDTVVTEPYLGPPLFKKPDNLLIQKILPELDNLYLAAFKIFGRILKPGGKVVIVFPAFEENGRLQFVDIMDDIASLGFDKEALIPEELIPDGFVELTQRGTILYGGSGNFLIREILLFRKR